MKSIISKSITCALIFVLSTTHINSKNISFITPKEYILGCWFQPHAAFIQMKFRRDGQFEFNDYNNILDKKEVLRGHYSITGTLLTLFYNDRPKQNFRYYKGSKGDTNYYIKNGGYYLVKSGATCDW